MIQNQINISDVVKLCFSFVIFFLSCWKFKSTIRSSQTVHSLTTITREPNCQYLSLSSLSFFFKAAVAFLQLLCAFLLQPVSL